MATTGKGAFGPGVSFGYPAISSADVSDVFDWINSTDGGWTWLTIDLAARAKVIMQAWEVKPGQVAASVNGLVIYFNGMAPGERMTLVRESLPRVGALVLGGIIGGAILGLISYSGANLFGG